MSCGTNCLPTVSRQFLTRNYPRPNCLLKCLPNCLSPTREGFLSSFKTNPAVRVFARQARGKKFSRGINLSLLAHWVPLNCIFSGISGLVANSGRHKLSRAGALPLRIFRGLEWPWGPPNAVIAKGRNRGITRNAIVA